MNICFICSEYPPFSHGGIGVYTKSMAEELQKIGHKVVVIGIYRDLDTHLIKEYVNEVEIYRINIPNIKFLGWLFARFQVLKLINQLIKNNLIDIIEDNDWDVLTGFLGISKIPTVLRLHNGNINNIKKISEIGFIKSLLLNDIAKRSEKIIGVSNSIIERFKELTKSNDLDKFTRIYNGVEIPKISNNYPQNRKSIL